jgi:hypothetical protein
MFAWLKEFYEVRAIRRASLREERAEERAETRVCESCETLKRQLEIRNHEYELLLNRFLEKPAPVVEDKTPVALTSPRHIPWRIRQQELEAADRQRAALLKNAPKPIEVAPVEIPSTDELEKEVVGGPSV